MKSQLILAAVVLLSAAAPAIAGDNGRTICVLRARPVAIQPVYRPVVRTQRVGYGTTNSNYGYGYGSSHGYSSSYGYGGSYGYGYAGYGYSPGYYRVPAVYGQVNQRLHYVAPCLPNGYVGGLRNLPTNVVQIPPTFGKPAYGAPAPRPAPPVSAAPLPAARGGR